MYIFFSIHNTYGVFGAKPKNEKHYRRWRKNGRGKAYKKKIVTYKRLIEKKKNRGDKDSSEERKKKRPVFRQSPSGSVVANAWK